MRGMTIPNEAWVLVANGGRAILYRNQGNEARLDLRVVDIFDQHGKATGPSPVGANFLHEIGRGSRGAVLEEPRADLVALMGTELARAHARGLFRALVLVAPPRILGSLRAALPNAVADVLTGVLPRDLVRLDVESVEAQLLAA